MNCWMTVKSSGSILRQATWRSRMFLVHHIWNKHTKDLFPESNEESFGRCGWRSWVMVGWGLVERPDLLFDSGDSDNDRGLLDQWDIDGLGSCHLLQVKAFEHVCRRRRLRLLKDQDWGWKRSLQFWRGPQQRKILDGRPKDGERDPDGISLLCQMEAKARRINQILVENRKFPTSSGIGSLLEEKRTSWQRRAVKYPE